jgi:hypothetical protein
MRIPLPNSAQILGLGSVLFLACLGGNSYAWNAIPQAQERTIRKLPVQRYEPVDIAAVKLNGKSVELNKSFFSDDESWLNSLKITIRNRSDKAILFAAITLQFPRPAGSQGPIIIHDISFGNRALLTSLPNQSQASSELLPGGTVDIQAPPGEFDAVREHSGDLGYSTRIQAVDFRIGKVIFDDDTMWSLGTYFRRDPKDPSTWVNEAASWLGPNGSYQEDHPPSWRSLANHGQP